MTLASWRVEDPRPLALPAAYLTPTPFTTVLLCAGRHLPPNTSGALSFRVRCGVGERGCCCLQSKGQVHTGPGMGPGLWEEAWWPQLSYLASLLAGESHHRADAAVGGDATLSLYSAVIVVWSGAWILRGPCLDPLRVPAASHSVWIVAH